MIELEVDKEGASPAEADIFFQPEFFSLHRRHYSGHYFRALDGEAVVGVSTFLESEPGHFASPLRGSYGGFWMCPGTKLSALEAFVEEATGFLTTHAGATKLSVVLPPTAHDPSWSASQFTVLSSAGFRPAGWEISQHLKLGRGPFRQGVLKEKRRYLNKLAKSGVVARLADPADYESLYELLATSRIDGMPLSMTWPQVFEMVEAFPERVFFVESVDRGTAVAAVLVLVLNPRTTYTLYYGNKLGVDGSPVLAALQHLHEWGAKRDFALMDLGASSVGGAVSHSIFDFKASIGALPSMKFWMARNL